MKIFIVGCGRSGTTLLRTMLNHHRDVFIPLECYFISDYLKYGHKLNKKSLLKMFFKEPQLLLWFKQSNNLETESVSPEKLTTLIHEVAMKKENKKIWGQKTPRFIRDYELFKKYFPDIKYLFLVRDPRAVVNSFKASKAHNSHISYIVKRWINDNKLGLSLLQDYPDDTELVKFEELISQPRKVLEDICSFLGIDFDPNVLNYNIKGDAEYSSLAKKTIVQLNVKPNRETIKKWIQHLSTKEIVYIENKCKELMNVFGYKTLIEGNSNSIPSYFHYTCLLYWIPVFIQYLTEWPEELFYNFYRKCRLAIATRSFYPFSPTTKGKQR